MAKVLRKLLAQDGMITAPGCFDCIGARAIERGGFAAAYMSGGSVAGALGFPDYGLTSATEMVDVAGHIATSINIPVIADADTGFGNELNVIRVVREFEQRGIAAIHIEDQEFPKRCGHLDGKRLIPRDEFARKIRAAADARRNTDFVIIARTDARAVTGFDDAISRANAALEAGADMAFVEAPQSLEEMAQVPKRVRGPCVLNILGQGSKTPELTLQEAASLGYKLGIMPGLLLRSYLEACTTALDAVQRTGVHPVLNKTLTPSEIFALFGAEEWDRARVRYGE